MPGTERRGKDKGRIREGRSAARGLERAMHGYLNRNQLAKVKWKDCQRAPKDHLRAKTGICLKKVLIKHSTVTSMGF